MENHLLKAETSICAGNLDEAEVHINRASLLLNDFKDNIPLTIHYKKVYALFLDHRGKFIEAAQRYYELTLKAHLDGEQKKFFLQKALSCTLLAAPSVQQNRLMTSLYKDERTDYLLGYSLLKDMYLERLIKRSQLTEFENTLSAHQKVIDSDGYSILQRSVIEQNMLAASKLFANITFDGLANLIGISTSNAEKIATKMISNEGLNGSIDQIDRIVYFESDSNPLSEWDQNIHSICELVNSISETISTKYSECLPAQK